MTPEPVPPRMATREWWHGLPKGLKILFLTVSLPAWAYIMLSIIVGKAGTMAAFAAFCIFALSAIPHAIDKRSRENRERSGFDMFGDGD